MLDASLNNPGLSMNAVVITSDTSTLLNALAKTFSSSFTVLGELLQNARRAGATQVNFCVDDEVIVVEDDGCGIDSFDTLFSVARSGWDGSIKAAESPYGMGFAATWFACEQLEVVSKGRSLKAETSDLLALKPAAILPVACNGKTTITLRNYTMGKKQKVICKIEEYSKGFPIPVFINGEEVMRPDAHDERFIQTSIGYATVEAILNTSGRTYYLQGLPISVNGDELRYRLHPSVIHLDATKFEGRMPDRDVVIDPEKSRKVIKLALDAAARIKLQELASTLPAHQFIEEYSQVMVALGMHDLHNSFDIIPTKWVSIYADHPILPGDNVHDNQEYPRAENKVLSRTDLTKHGLFSITENDSEEDLRAAVAVYQIEGYIACPSIPSWHWAHELITEISPDDFDVSTEADIGETKISVWGYQVDLMVSEKVSLVTRRDIGMPTRIEVPFIYSTEHRRLFVNPEDVDTDCAVRQVTNFDDDDTFDEVAKDRAEEALRSTILMITNKDPAVLLKRFIDLGITLVPDEFVGKAFQVTFDADKRAQVTLIE